MNVLRSTDDDATGSIPAAAAILVAAGLRDFRLSMISCEHQYLLFGAVL
jgi:hypothetical protein